MKLDKIEYIVINYSELDVLVTNEYGVEWEFIADQEAVNDTCIRFNIEGNNLDSYDRELLDKFITTKGREPGYGMCRLLLEDLAWSGLIPKGKYLIEVEW